MKGSAFGLSVACFAGATQARQQATPPSFSDLFLPTTPSQQQQQQQRRRRRRQQRKLADAPSPSPAIANTTTTIVVDSNSTLLTRGNCRWSLAGLADQIFEELNQELSKELELLAGELFPRAVQLDDCEVQILFDDDGESPVDQVEVAGGDVSNVAELRAAGKKRRRSSRGHNDRRSRKEERKARRESRSKSTRRRSSRSGSSINAIERSSRRRRKAFVSTGRRHAATRGTRTTSDINTLEPSTSSGSANFVARRRQGFGSASGTIASATAATPAVIPRGRRLRPRPSQPSSVAKRPERLRQETSLADKADAYENRSGAGAEGHAAPGAGTGNSLSGTSRYAEEIIGVRRRDATSFKKVVVSSSVQTRAVLTTAAVGAICAVVASARHATPLVLALSLSAVHVTGSMTWALREASWNDTVLARRQYLHCPSTVAKLAVTFIFCAVAYGLTMVLTRPLF